MGVQPHVARHRLVVVAVLRDEGDEELALAHRHRLDCDLSWWHLELQGVRFVGLCPLDEGRLDPRFEAPHGRALRADLVRVGQQLKPRVVLKLRLFRVVRLRRILEEARRSRLEDGGLDLDGGARALLLRPRTRTRHPLATQAQTQARGAE